MCDRAIVPIESPVAMADPSSFENAGSNGLSKMVQFPSSGFHVSSDGLPTSRREHGESLA